MVKKPYEGETNFLNISPRVCLKAYPTLLQNVNQKIESARFLAENQKDYGSAIGLLIVSHEESIKALFLFLEGSGFKLRNIPGISSVFTNHRLRYLVSLTLSIGTIVMEDFMRYVKMVLKEPDNLKELLSIPPERMLIKLKYYFLRRYISVLREVEWYSNIELARQQGNYSDYGNIGLISPLNVQKVQYELFYERISNLNAAINEFITYHGTKGSPGVKQLKMVCHMVKKDKTIYEGAAKTMKIVNKRNYDSYEAMREILSDIYETFTESKSKDMVSEVSTMQNKMKESLFKIKFPEPKEKS